MKFPTRFINKFFNVVIPGPVLTGRKQFHQKAGGVWVTEDSAMTSSAFYRGVIYLSTQIAKLPLTIKDKMNNEFEDSPIYYLLNVAPNSETTSFHFKLFLLQCAIICGNGYAEIERSVDGRPIALWPIDPRKVSPMRDANNKLWYQVTGGGNNRETVYLRPDEILILRNFHTLDGNHGIGVVEYGRQVLGISLGADTFAASLFVNGGMPSGVLTSQKRMDDAAFARLTSSWKEQYGGRKTGSVAVLEDGVTYSPISHSPDVLQFLESRKFSVEEIARYLGVPPQKLFTSESAKYSNMEQANLEVSTDILDAWARNWESEIDIKLLSGRRGGRRSEMDLYAISRGDMTTRSNYFMKMMQNASMTPYEIRKKEGWKLSADQNRFYIAANNFIPVDRMDEKIDSDIKSKETPAPTSPPEPSEVERAAAKYLLDR